MNYAKNGKIKDVIKITALNFTRIIVFIISIISSFFIAYNFNQSGYEYLFILPLAYGIVYVFFLAPVLFKNTNAFLVVFVIFTFTRYVVLPNLLVYTNYYGGNSSVPPLSSSYQLAIWLMVYEIVVVAIAIYLIFRNVDLNKLNESKNIKTPNNFIVYFLFLTITLLLIGSKPSVLNSFYFIIPPDNLTGFDGRGLLSSITFYFLVISKYIVYLMLMTLLYKMFSKKNRKIYIFLSFIVTALNILVIYGDNRADFIITAIVSITIFYKLYPKQSKLAIIVLILSMFVAVSFINTHRDHATRTGGADQVLDITNTLQIYMGGPYNVAIAIEAAKLNQEARSIAHFGYDILRPTLGFNLLLKNIDMKMSGNYFNERIYFSDHTTQIIPMIGQGYFFFGFIFSPIVMILFLFFVKYLITVREGKARIELVFFLSIPITRIGLAMGQNGSILMNDTSFFLLLSLAIYYLNNKLTLNKSVPNTIRTR